MKFLITLHILFYSLLLVLSIQVVVNVDLFHSLLLMVVYFLIFLSIV